MSLIDLILKDKIIVIGVAVALLPLFFAIVLTVRKVLRRTINQRAQQKAAEAARQAALAVELENVAALAGPDTQVDEAVPQSDALKPPQAGPEVTADADEETASSDESTQEQPADEMQSLLSSVFGDEASDAHYDVLLQGVETLDIDDLLTLCNDVASQLGVHAEQQGA